MEILVWAEGNVCVPGNRIAEAATDGNEKPAIYASRLGCLACSA